VEVRNGLAWNDPRSRTPSDPAAREVDEAETPPAAIIDAAVFDSIGWENDAVAIDRGATVYAYSCARCHGDSGAGNGNYRLQGRLLRPPSFRTEDWQYANDLEGLRHAIFAGNREKGMPCWSDAGLAPRDADAVARYITRRLWAGI
jgi:mono/diheme cytochrome c family protein